MIKKYIIPALFIALASGTAMAQISLSGEFRPRTEYSHGYGTLSEANQKASLFTSQRTRLNLNFKSPLIVTKLVLQDVRIWGSQKQLVLNEESGISIHEAWAEAPIGKSFSFRLGRQELVYDNQRMFGNVNWLQQGRSHDLALLKYKGFVDAHLGIAYNESGTRTNNLYLGPDAYKFMQFLWVHKAFGKLSASILAINNGVAKNTKNDKGEVISQSTVFTQTVGPYLEYKTKSLTLSGNLYYQTGTLVSGQDLSAFEYLIQGDWKATEKISAGLAYEVLSGTGTDSPANESTSFNPLYGTNHKFNGLMDYFYVGNHIGSVGLKDLTASLAYTAGKMKLGLDAHGFSSSAPLPGALKLYLGTEFDLSAGYKINSSIDLMVGYSQLLATKSMEFLKGGSAAGTHNWAWVMFTFKVPE